MLKRWNFLKPGFYEGINLYLTEKEGGLEFTREDETLLGLFVAQAAMAIRNARLFEHEQKARAEAESARLALAQSEEALRGSEKQFRDVLGNTTAVVFIKDTEGRYTFVNRRYLEQFHVTNEDVAGKTDHDLFPSETADILRANDEEVLKTGTSLELEEVVPQDDGPHTYLSIKFLLYDESKAPYAVCGIATDITDRKRAEETVETERQRLETLVSTSPVGVVAVDADNETILLINREAQRLLGVHEPGDRLEQYERAARRETPDGRELSPDDLPIRRALIKGETVRAEEVHFKFDDGRTVPTLMNATPIYADDGHVSAAFVVIQDVSPLEELEKLRSEFLGIVSHELRTPLTAIKGSAATVLGSPTPFDMQEIREFFQIIDEQADRLRDLVSNLLDMTRIEAGSLSVTPEPMDLRDAVNDAVDTFNRSGVHHQVQVDVPDDLPEVNADRTRLGQVLNNLLSNAGKFSPEASTIAVDIRRDNSLATVHVRDDGRGIPVKKLPHVFNKFYQAHDDSGSVLFGSGLGLAICKGIVEAHGGRISVESPGEGRGSTFSFTIPLAVEAGTTPVADLSKKADHLGRVARAGERTRILAVDDEPQVLRYLQNTLKNAGYQPVATTDPSEVTKLVEMEEPQLVLLDVNLPGVSGFDLLQQIREISGVPVIFLSASDREADTVQALKLGADDYVTKPFSPSELLARIEASLRRRLTSDQLEVRPPFELDGLAIDFAARRVTVAGSDVRLTATEYKLLYELATNAGRVLTHDQILQRVWGPEYSGETQLVRAFIRTLRRKLGDDARDPKYIFTEPQVGYRVAKPESTEGGRRVSILKWPEVARRGQRVLF